MIETDIAWAAGLIDGEGCISIRKSKPNIEYGEKNYVYNATLTVGMTHLPTVEKLNTIFPGYMQCCIRENENWKTQIRWYAKNIELLGILQTLLPYLICKKDDAKTTIEFLMLPKATSFKETPSWLLLRREELYQQAKNNKKYEFKNDILKYKRNKTRKMDEFINCPICNIVMHKYHNNGISSKTCSRKCRDINRHANISSS